MVSESILKYVTANQSGGKTLDMLRIYSVLKDAPDMSLVELGASLAMPVDILTEMVKELAERRVVEFSRHQQNGDPFQICCRECDGKGFLGISFDEEGCSLTVLDPRGDISREEKLYLTGIKNLRGRVGELKELVKAISEKTTFKGIPLRSGGVVEHSLMAGKDGKGLRRVADGLSRVFKCEIIATRKATVSAYLEKQKGPAENKHRSVLYFYTDSGEGVLIQGENITESSALDSEREAYLRAWGQFNAVKTARELVEKGVGTDIVSLVKGDMEGISISKILEAAENGDELAEDLTRRSALALGVRGAFLANIFDIDLIVLGGGLENPSGKFKEYMEESFEKFLLNEKKGKIEIVRGVSVEKFYSLGAALLSRRELFTEV